LYAILLSKPAKRRVTLLDVAAQPGSVVHMLGAAENLRWSADGRDLRVQLPRRLPGDYAFVLEIESAS
jgi:hypothetical protein